LGDLASESKFPVQRNPHKDKNTIAVIPRPPLTFRFIMNLLARYIAAWAAPPQQWMQIDITKVHGEEPLKIPIS
jgi:hypothetical protein